MIGETIDGRYRVLRILGQGGMGAVYEAEHTGTGRRVAVKVILNADLAKHDSIVQRFQREAKAAGSIETDHIVEVLDTGMDVRLGAPYMVMEFLRGEDVADLVKRCGCLPPELALRIAGQACTGLLKAHEGGVIHRDIKPANLFLSRRESGDVVVKVVDFGIAKVIADIAGPDDTGLTRTGNLLGSPRYMSPEQAMGLKTIDHRTDVWSMGVVLYEALTGRVPHAHCESATAASSAPAPVAAPAPTVAERVVRLEVVAPPTAVVEVDDLPVPVQSGSVEFSGLLGTTHRVRIRLGKIETVSEVVIADSGVVPPKMQFGVPFQKSPKGGEPGGKVKPATKTSETGVSRKFD